MKKELEKLGIEILETGLETGLVAKLGSGRPVIALRADIDGLPIAEAAGLAFSSKNPGVMQACGHDLHMASLLGAAEILREQDFSGTIKLIFQPAEEVGLGAEAVMATGVLDDVEAFLGWHNIPGLPVGELGLLDGGVMAAVERFRVELTGVGSHAAYPQEGRDVLLALSATVQNLQQLVARNVGPLEAAVVSVTHIEGGQTWNILPDNAFFEGTIRTFDDEVRKMIKSRFVEIVEGTARLYGVSAKVDWVMEADLTYNEPELTELVRQANPGSTTPEPSSAGEDFANYRKIAPSVFALIGSNRVGAVGLHHADTLVLDDCLPLAVEYYVNSGLALLKNLKK